MLLRPAVFHRQASSCQPNGTALVLLDHGFDRGVSIPRALALVVRDARNRHQLSLQLGDLGIHSSKRAAPSTQRSGLGVV